MKVTRFIKLLACLIFFLTINTSHALNEQAIDPPPVDWQFFHLSDGWYGLQGWLKNRASYLNMSDLRFELALDKLMDLPGYSALIEVQNLTGLRPNLYVDSIQGFDNYEFDRFPTMTYLYQLWLQKQIGDHWSVLAGFYDLNAEFNITDSSTLLILPAFQSNSEFAQTGPNGPSIYPIIGSGARVKFVPQPHWYFQAVVLDAAAANPLNRAYAYPPFGSGQGVLGVYEMGYMFLDKQDNSNQGKIALGLWGYSKKVFAQGFHTLTSARPPENNYGYYIMVDYPWYVDNNAGKSIRGFVRYGGATSITNNFNKALSAGFTITGFIPSRSKDVFSFGLAPAWTFPESRLFNTGISIGEFQYEVTYAFMINDWLILQPDLIYISFPKADRNDFRNAFLPGGRIIVKLEKIQDKL